ncbi:multidrug effflux MFS transporter [Pseudaestuariivita sp.]|uniref:multidrug effflux MFS transporter n=1 Tax=Pseudaestuariivita sp. TaxID=2211669 RepID=UPI004059B142
MSDASSDAAPARHSHDMRMSRVEFIALMGMTFATIAFSIDSMLPALPDIGREIGDGLEHYAPLIILSFVVGMGVGTLFTGPLSDAVGRKPVILGGAALYILGSLVAWLADSFEVILAARVLQGLGASGPRVVAIAVIRDLYAGRGMAKILSFAMIVFTLFPAVAPLIGAGIIWLADWRAIFLAFVVFGLTTSLWTLARLPETLPRERRRPMGLALISAALQEMWRIPVVRISTLVQCFCFATIFAGVTTIQLIFDQTFDMAASFPWWFFGMAIIGGSASFLNAMIVERMGMRRVISLMLIAQVALSAVVLAATLGGLAGTPFFVLCFVWLTSIFFQAGLTIGNVNALAMEPLGHIAGIATSVIGSIATVVAGVLVTPVALLFTGTPLTLAIGTLFFATAALALMQQIKD